MYYTALTTKYPYVPFDLRAIGVVGTAPTLQRWAGANQHLRMLVGDPELTPRRQKLPLPIEEG